MNTANRFWLGALSAALVVSACGGGGGGSAATPFSAAANGTAGKGIIQGGTVTAQEITSSGLVDRDTTTTDSSGDYSLNIGADYTGGPLLITISGNSSATMKCDVQAGCPNGGTTAAFGTTVPLASSFAMRTIVPVVTSGADLTRCVTPFTELAVNRAVEIAGNIDAVDATIMNSAFSQVSNLLGGLDVQRTCVIDTTDPTKVADATPEQLALSGLSAATLSANSAAGDPTAAVDNLKAAFANGQITSTALRDLTTHAASEIQAVDDGSQNNVYYGEMDSSADDADANSGGTVSPQPSDNASSAGVDKGKALVAEVRNIAMNYVHDANSADANSANPDATVVQFANEVNAASTATDATPMFDAFIEGLSFAGANFDAATDGSSAAYTTYDAAQAAQTLTATYHKSSTGNQLSSVDLSGTIYGYTMNVTVSSPTVLVDGTQTLHGTATGSIKPTDSTAVDMEMSLDGDALVTNLTYDGTTYYVTGYDKGTFSGNLTIKQDNVPNGLQFTGKADITAVPCTGCDYTTDKNMTANPDLVVLQGTFSRIDGTASLGAKVTVDMTAASAASFDERMPISDTNSPLGTVMVQADASLQGWHTYQAVLTASLNKVNTWSGGAAGANLPDVDAKVTISLQRDGQTLKIEAVPQTPSATATSTVVDVTITTPEGTAIVLNNLDDQSTSAVLGDVTVDGAKVGSLERASNGTIIIRWTDGTIESLG